MKAFRICIVIICSILLILTIINAKQYHNKLDNKEFYGVFIEKKYIETLKSTKSLRQAQLSTLSSKGKSHWITYEFHKTKNNKNLCTITNLHEGYYNPYILRKLNQDNEYIFYFYVSSSSYDSIYITKKPDYYIFHKKNGRGSFYIDTMIKVLSYNSRNMKDDELFKEYFYNFINSIVIEGTYYDSKNRKFVFTKDRKAIWPDKRFSYTLGIDFLEGNTAEFIVIKNNDTKEKRFYYQWYKNKLYIYSKEPLIKNNLLHVLTPGVNWFWWK